MASKQLRDTVDDARRIDAVIISRQSEEEVYPEFAYA